MIKFKITKLNKIHQTGFAKFLISVSLILLIYGAMVLYHFISFEKPKISVVMPVYNTEFYLKRSISGVLNQTFKDFELILVNDGSTDNSLEIMQKFAKKDKRIKVINLEKNSGAGAARNEGIKHITGEYTLFVDSDDFMFPIMLEKMYNHAQLYNLDMVMCLAYAINGKSREMLSIPLVDEYYSFAYSYLQENNISVFSYKDLPKNFFQISRKFVWDKLIKTSIIKDNNLYFDNVPIHNDSFFITMAMLHAQRIGYITDRVYLYTEGRSEAISKKVGYNLKSVYQTFVKIKAELEKMGILDDLYDSYISWIQYYIPLEGQKLETYDNYHYKYYLLKLKSDETLRKLEKNKTEKLNDEQSGISQTE